jgi:flagellar motor component MotA
MNILIKKYGLEICRFIKPRQISEILTPNCMGFPSNQNLADIFYRLSIVTKEYTIKYLPKRRQKEIANLSVSNNQDEISIIENQLLSEIDRLVQYDDIFINGLINGWYKLGVARFFPKKDSNLFLEEFQELSKQGKLYLQHLSTEDILELCLLLHQQYHKNGLLDLEILIENLSDPLLSKILSLLLSDYSYDKIRQEGNLIGNQFLDSIKERYQFLIKHLPAYADKPEINSKMPDWKKEIINWHVITENEGLLALEEIAYEIKDPFYRYILQLLVDGMGDSNHIAEQKLKTEIRALEDKIQMIIHFCGFIRVGGGKNWLKCELEAFIPGSHNE